MADLRFKIAAHRNVLHVYFQFKTNWIKYIKVKEYKRIYVVKSKGVVWQHRDLISDHSS